MASNYPAAADDFTTKVDGFDDVMAADVNALQDAVRAVQATLGLDPQGMLMDVASRLDTLGSVETDTIFTALGDLVVGLNQSSATALAVGQDGQKLVPDSSNVTGTGLRWIDDDFSVSVLIGDGTNAVSPGFKGFVSVPYDCALEVVTLAADVAGSIVVDIWKGTMAALPTAANSICSASKPALTSTRALEDSALAGRTVALAKGDVLGFNVDSASTVKLVTLALSGRKTAVS